MENPKVFVLTRFAEEIGSRAGGGFSSDWWDWRISLVQQWTEPSLRRQTAKNFEWLVSISETASPQQRQTLVEAVAGVATVVVQKGLAPSEDVFRPRLRKEEGPYWTIRLDSDDMIHPEFIAELSRERLPVGAVLSFPSGAILNLEPSFLALRRLSNNPFLAHFGENGDNVFGLGHHGKVSFTNANFFFAREKKDPMWLQLVHSDNLANRVQPWDRPALTGNVLKKFGVLPLRLNVSQFSPLRWFEFLRHLVFFKISNARR
jgi:hypothetical protein